MFQDLADHRRVFYAGNDPYRPPALLTGFDVDTEHEFQALGPGHSGMTLGGVSVIGVAVSLLRPLASLAPPGWSDGCPMFAVRRAFSMKASGVDPGQQQYKCYSVVFFLEVGC